MTSIVVVQLVRKAQGHARSKASPDSPINQYSRSLVPKAMSSMVLVIRDLQHSALGPSGFRLGC